MLLSGLPELFVAAGNKDPAAAVPLRKGDGSRQLPALKPILKRISMWLKSGMKFGKQGAGGEFSTIYF